MVYLGKKKPSAQKHPLIEIIKYNGPEDVLIWKYPHEDFNTNTQLIVGPGQEAILVKGGQVLERFTSGTHVLDTKNYPFIRSLVERVTDGISPFACAVYFVNTTVAMGIEWGTDTPISIDEPRYQVSIGICSYGNFSLKVINAYKLMEKLVGHRQGINPKEIQQFFSLIMTTQARSVISHTIQQEHLSLIGIDAHLADMSAKVAEQIRPIFQEYGMEVKHFTIGSISTPDLDKLKAKEHELKMHRMDTDVSIEDQRKQTEAQAFANRELGIQEQEKWAAQIGQSLASNTGPNVNTAGGVCYPGMGGVATIVQPSAAGTAEIVKTLLNRPQAPNQDSIEERARQVKKLLDSGYITEEQYQMKIEKLLNEI